MRQAVHDQVTLPAGRAALVLVDLQQEQRADPDYAAYDIDRVLGNAQRLLAAARSCGCPVGHAKYVRDFSVEPPRPFEATRADGAPTFSDAKAGLTEFCAEVAPTKQEAVFVKNDASAFGGTQLGAWLGGHQAQWVIICGVWTDACVAATVRDASAAGYRVLLVKDACGSGTKTMHETAVLDLANRLYGGGICDTDRATRLLSGKTAPVWRVVDPVPFRYTAATISALYDSL